MTNLRAFSILMVLIGAAVLFFSFLPAKEIWGNVKGKLRRKWLVIFTLMTFFLLANLFLAEVMFFNRSFPFELVTGGVFLGGALFVFIVIDLCQRTIVARLKVEDDIQALNESLEQRVADRTRELKRLFDFNRTVLDSVADGISIIDVDSFRIVDANQAFLNAFDLPEGQVIGRTCYEVTHHRTSSCIPPNDCCPLLETLSNGDHAAVEHVHWTHSGEKRYVEVRTSPIRDEKGAIVQAIHIQRDITERKEAEEKIRQLAFYDVLTNLPNRRLLLDRLNQALAQAKRSKCFVAVMFLDLDRFKQVNDTLGHDAGDQLLKVVADRLVVCVRETDTVCRQGGDEFIIVLNEVIQPHDVIQVEKRIHESIREPMCIQENELRISTSIGIAVSCGDSAESAYDLMKNADKAMYEAKNAKRNLNRRHDEVTRIQDYP